MAQVPLWQQASQRELCHVSAVKRFLRYERFKLHFAASSAYVMLCGSGNTVTGITGGWWKPVPYRMYWRICSKQCGCAVAEREAESN